MSRSAHRHLVRHRGQGPAPELKPVRLLVLNMAMDLDTPSKEFMVAWVRRLGKFFARMKEIEKKLGL